MIVSHVAANKMVCCQHPHDHDFGRRRFCVTDQCMAWRSAGIKAKGYCGLAGKPSAVMLEEGKSAVEFLRETLKKGGVL